MSDKIKNSVVNLPETVIIGDELYRVSLCKIVNTMGDAINHPSHYQGEGGMECIQAIKGSMPPDGFQDYCKGNILKYIWRYRSKNGVEDLKKAKVYLDFMIESAEERKPINV